MVPADTPPTDVDRLADAVAALAGRVAERDVAAQLHALAGIVRNIHAPQPDAAQRDAFAAELTAAMAAGDEPGALRAARRLAALERAGARRVDWSAASRG